jgi:hypothetical protein
MIRLWVTVFLLLSAGCKKPETKIVKAPDPIVFERPSQRPPDLPPATPGFVDLNALEDRILIDVQTLPSDDERLRTRYLIACDYFNSGLNLEQVEAGANKLINSLSTERFLKKVIPVGNAGCIYRIDLDDFGITYNRRQVGGAGDSVHARSGAPEWIRIEQSLLLDFVSNTIRNQNIQFLTQTLKPYVWLNDFSVTVMESDPIADQGCGLYCDIVEQAIDQDTFLASQGLDLQDEADSERLLMAGFSQSQIALGKTRLVSIAETNNGYCLISYDSDLNNQISAFQFPFTDQVARAGGVLRTDKIFEEAAGELLCTNANGMYTHRLQDGDGIAAAFAPNSIVVNLFHSALDPTIRLGDCFGCHVTMGISFRDEIQRAVERNPGFNSEEKNLANIFYDDVRIQAVLSEINSAYANALREIGVNSSEDPVNKALIEKFREEVDIVKASAWTFLDVTEFRERLQGSAISSQVLQNLLSGGTVSIGVFSDNFSTLVEELNLFEDSDIN